MKTTAREKELHRLIMGIRRCRKCPLHRHRTHAVPGEGPVQANILFVGEAPGKDEDKQGRPFVGHSGQFLDRLMDGVGITRSSLYTTSSVKCRPLKNRTPHAKELEMCRKAWLDRQISLIDPKLIVLLGKVPLRQMLGKKENLSNLHGQTFKKDGRTFLVTYHPAAAMRFPKIKDKIRQDIKKVAQFSNS